MQAVDVLRHDREDLARALERHDCMVHGVGLRVLVALPRLELLVPVLNARRFRRHEVVVVHGPPARPETAGTAKIRNAARGRDPRPDEDEHAPGGGEELNETPVAHASLSYSALSATIGSMLAARAAGMSA